MRMLQPQRGSTNQDADDDAAAVAGGISRY